MRDVNVDCKISSGIGGEVKSAPSVLDPRVAAEGRFAFVIGCKPSDDERPNDLTCKPRKPLAKARRGEVGNCSVVRLFDSPASSGLNKFGFNSRSTTCCSNDTVSRIDVILS